MIFDFEPGDKVVNPNKKEWGIGQIQSIIKEKITVNFENAGKKVINGNIITLEKFNIIPKIGLRFITLSSEEQRLQGSFFHVKNNYKKIKPRFVLNCDELSTGNLKGIVLGFPHLRKFLQDQIDTLDENLKADDKIYYLSPKGKLFDQKLAKELSKEKKINLICGHFEGVDQRVIDSRNIIELSIGDFVLSGGESAVFVVMDAILRLSIIHI